MVAIAERRLSLEEFHALYDAEKPYFEYWAGEAVQKSMPTRLHALIQTILVRWLGDLGYEAGQEITIKLVPDYEPIPDVIAAEGSIEDPYPTKPFEVAIEILSPADPFSRVVRKCEMYAAWGIRQVIVVDPNARQVWSFGNGSLRESDSIAKRGDQTITAAALWAEIDRQRSKG